MDPQKVFCECKDLIAKSDFENLAEKLKYLDDDDHIEYLCLELKDKFEEKCNVINNKTNSLNRLDENALVSLKDSIEEIKRIQFILNKFIDESMASKINETTGERVKIRIKKIISETSDQKDVLDFSKKKANQVLLIFLAGTEILSEINKLKVNSPVTKDSFNIKKNNEDMKNQNINISNSILNCEKEITENKLTSMLISVQNGLQAFKVKKLEAFIPEIEKLRKATDLLNA
jgi:hypothetical protein